MERYGVEIDQCTKCKGVWLDRGELEKVVNLQNRYEEDHYNRYHYRKEHDDDDDHEDYYYDKRKHKKRGFFDNLFDFD